MSHPIIIVGKPRKVEADRLLSPQCGFPARLQGDQHAGDNRNSRFESRSRFSSGSQGGGNLVRQRQFRDFMLQIMVFDRHGWELRKGTA